MILLIIHLFAGWVFVSLYVFLIIQMSTLVSGVNVLTENDRARDIDMRQTRLSADHAHRRIRHLLRGAVPSPPLDHTRSDQIGHGI